jgi:hypothetical protein
MWIRIRKGTRHKAQGRRQREVFLNSPFEGGQGDVKIAIFE